LNLFKKVLFTFIFCFLITNIGAVEIPLPPTGIKAKTLPNGLVVISWTDSSSPSVAGYNLYFHKLNENNFELWNKYLIISGTEKPLWQWKTGTYCFRIRSVGVNRPGPESVDSKEIWVKVGDQKIDFEKIPLKTKGQGFIDIAKETNMKAFPKPEPNKILGYDIYMSEDLDRFWLMNEEPIGNVESFSINNLEVFKKYYFTLAIVVQGAESVKSELSVVSAKPVTNH